MVPELEPRYNYRINRTPANLTRGVFNAAFTGRFLGYAHNLAPREIEILIEQCPGCDAGQFYVTADDLYTAGGVIACEYCDHELKPVKAE